ncbi:MAG: flagellar hook-basal body complex protein FliE [Chloroflexota bacterium]
MAAINPLGGVSALIRASAAAAPTGVGAAGGAASVNGAPNVVGSVGATGGTAGAGQVSASGGSFLDSLGDALGQLNTQLNTADASMASFASGGSADLHTVMLELQQASIGLKTGLAVRDKLLEAYQELMRLQI